MVFIIEGSSTPSFEGCKIHDNKTGVLVDENSKPSLKDCEIYGHEGDGIWVEDQASGVYTNCHIYLNRRCGLFIEGSSTPNFEDCKIHFNILLASPLPGVVVAESSEPYLKDCEIYDHLSYGILVKDQARGTYKNCYLHNKYNIENFSNKTSNTIDTSTCRME